MFTNHKFRKERRAEAESNGPDRLPCNPCPFPASLLLSSLDRGPLLATQLTRVLGASGGRGAERAGTPAFGVAWGGEWLRVCRCFFFFSLFLFVRTHNLFEQADLIHVVLSGLAGVAVGVRECLGLAALAS